MFVMGLICQRWEWLLAAEPGLNRVSIFWAMEDQLSLLVAGRQEEGSDSFALFWDVHGYPVALVTADSNDPDPPMPLGGRFHSIFLLCSGGCNTL